MMREIEVYQLQDHLEEMAELISDQETRKQIFHDIRLHWDQKGRGCKVTISTPIAAIYNYMQAHKSNNTI
ncbi:hypothetical protein [Paenibacillus bovis]|uniref:hypothetical protein n=1 Tax=Paenibacillus bovis TaxID=1616788 RepID=UPI001314E7AB|nr:hypothetical protein [Paenibacillus bovis]